MDMLFLYFVVFDPWRILLPLGLSIILLVALWFSGENVKNPYDLVKQSIGHIAVQSAVVLFVCTGFFGYSMNWLVASPLARDFGFWGTFLGMSDILETLLFCSGGYCLWKVRELLKCGKSSLKPWAGGAVCFFLLAAILWIVRWDGFVFGWVSQMGEISEAVSGWGLTRMLSKVVHLLLSAMAAGGLVVMMTGYLPWKSPRETKAPSPEDREAEEGGRIQVVRFGMAWVLIGVVPQVVVGSWLLVSLGEDVRNHFLHGLTLGSFLFFSSLIVALLGLVLINAAFIAPYVKGLVWGGGLCILITLYLMGFMRYESMAVGLSSLNREFHWLPLNLWSLIAGTFPMAGLLLLLIRGLKIALISRVNKPNTASLTGQIGQRNLR